ncbi:uncharacterized protein LOC119363707 isoform X1 [Triticum dicoccoides]|uniref:uncharacterized protein LOC119363707 isoform X1 n=1 Tax=Triticum dicoccoides TaxID=85692 RepID=UPI00188DDA7D|nr:uncharacterized protein LOC119363707 isoform X1 [Triticum dicoccoides]XP_044323738.1 uncharacterized protein LOC123044926 isoform X1 [Triticum aestivum]
MTRHTTCQSTLGKPDPARILHHPPLSGDHQPACGWGAILQIEEASNFRWRRPEPASGHAMVARHRHPPSRSAAPERWSEGHFLQGSGEHPHPDPICSSVPESSQSSPEPFKYAAPGRSKTELPTVREHNTPNPAAHHPVKGDLL